MTRGVTMRVTYPYVGPDCSVTVACCSAQAAFEFNALKASMLTENRLLPPSENSLSTRMFIVLRIGIRLVPYFSMRWVMVVELGKAGPPAGSAARKSAVRWRENPL